MSTEDVGRPARRPRLDNSELTKTGFWVGQIFMLLATVLGVYLAAQEGLSQAVAFDGIVSQQNNYYLRRSLRDELGDNLAVVEDYADFIAQHNPLPQRRKEHHPRLHHFVWENMRFSNQTLETPPAILSGARRFYAEVAQKVDRYEAQRLGARPTAKELKALTADIRSRVLPLMDQDLARLRQQLARHGVVVEQEAEHGA
ncbi:hypothetical protein [Gallaecimonas sp. GXIMD4217]|uniref:hypothetical protein n=1 Tax=Gallaecimonas sp. GXIMD4217 TaxID=3131927 RepID=UPI00311ABE0B